MVETLEEQGELLGHNTNAPTASFEAMEEIHRAYIKDHPAPELVVYTGPSSHFSVDDPDQLLAHFTKLTSRFEPRTSK